MRADECRIAVKLLSIEWEGKILAGLTMSAGVAAYPICPTSDALFREADSALYSAKALCVKKAGGHRPPLQV